MDIQALQALASLGSSMTVAGVLTLAWMLERQNVKAERARGDRLEQQLITTLEKTAIEAAK